MSITGLRAIDSSAFSHESIKCFHTGISASLMRSLLKTVQSNRSEELQELANKSC